MPEYVSSPRKRYPSVSRICEWCRAPFRAYPYEVRAGYGRFCSRRCGKQQPLAPRVWTKIGAPLVNGCRPWMANHDIDGYGKISVAGHPRTATHAVWFLATGHWPTKSEVVAHTCDWPPCCEFSHLFLTDTQGNALDCKQKGRQARGTRQRDAKLTDALVVEMRQRYAAGGISLTALGRLYGVCYATARAAVKGATWRHVAAP